MYKLKDAMYYENGNIRICDVYIDGGLFSFEAPQTSEEIVVLENCIFTPGFLDVHVHLREPGFSYKETIKTGTMAAAHGGYVGVCSMPNLNPVPDSNENLQVQLDIIKKDAVIDVYPYGAITKGEGGKLLSDMDKMSSKVCAYSDDGRGVQSNDMMREAMIKAKKLDKIIAAHCEDNSLLYGGYINDCDYAKANGHKGICNESEWAQIARDIELAKETGCAYHVCHISTKESAEIIRKAKAEGVNITCETGPHYLILDDSYLCEDARFKMNPPLRSREDRLALIEAIKDGTIDCIATDHAPHSAEEKLRGLANAPMGVVGIETAFDTLYEYLVKPGIVPLERILYMLCEAPRNRFKIESKPNTFNVFSYGKNRKIDTSEFLSMGKSTPFENMDVSSECLMTVVNGRIVWQSNTLKK